MKKLPIKISLPEKFFLTEEKCGYEISAKMKEVWAVEIDLLSEFRRVCEKHSLQWFATGGTLLGAARHQGFIPWDDDIDIMMPRADFDKLNAVALQEFKHPYFWQNEYTDPGSNRIHSKLRNSLTTGITRYEASYGFKCNLGIAIGIFPIDNIPSEGVERNLFIQEIEDTMNLEEMCLHEVYYFKPKYGRGIIKWFKHYVKYLLRKTIWCSKYNYRRYYDKIQILIKKYNTKPSEYVALLVLHLSERFYWKREWMSDTSYLPFENVKVPVPKGYVELLDHYYGDWHKYEMGTSLHGEIFFDATRPYTDYIKKMKELWS